MTTRNIFFCFSDNDGPVVRSCFVIPNKVTGFFALAL